ncbi:MAG: hypothetical protein WC413_03630 [Candidatus Nanoarchaeia archaeon]
MEIRRVNFSDLIEKIQSTPLTFIGDFHGDKKWSDNQKLILNNLNKDSFMLALEDPKEGIEDSYKEFKEITSQKNCLPLVKQFKGIPEFDYLNKMAEFICSYLTDFNKNLIAIIGKSHLEVEASLIKERNLIIQQSMNGTTYPGLGKGVYFLEKKADSEVYLIKEKL